MGFRQGALMAIHTALRRDPASPALRFSASALVLALSACAHAPAPLYSWEDFPAQQYAVLVHDGSSSPENQTHALEAQAEKARGTNAALPPGFRAHLGYLYLQAGNPGRARELWLAEKTAFPESAPYMERLIRKLDPPQTPEPDKVH
jgi:hypothetical protein